MEKLVRLHVEGFRSFRDLDLELGELTVLIGANGAGKSNLIAFFDMLSHMLAERLQFYAGRQGGGTAILHYGARITPELRSELNFEGTSGVSTFAFAMAHAAPDTLMFIRERIDEFEQPDHASRVVSQQFGGHLESKLLALSRSRSNRTAGKVASDIVRRLRGLQPYHFHDTSSVAAIRANQDLNRNLSLTSNGGNLAAFLYMLQESKPQHFQRILSSIRIAVPYLKELHLRPDQLNPERILLRWQDDNPDYEFGPHHLSDGSLRAIALITALLQPEEFMPGLILIDEPELGLHPSAIGLIASFVKSAAEKRQVVVATQSPKFLSEFSPEDVVVVEREEYEPGYGESVLRRLSREELGDWLNDYDLGTLYEMQVTGGGPR